MEKQNQALVGAWAIGILMAFTVSPEAGVAACIGYLGQWVKSVKGIPTFATQGGLIVVCVGVYALFHHPAWPPAEAWTRSAAQWALATLGVASLAAGTGGAARTDSRPTLI